MENRRKAEKRDDDNNIIMNFLLSISFIQTSFKIFYHIVQAMFEEFKKLSRKGSNQKGNRADWVVINLCQELVELSNNYLVIGSSCIRFLFLRSIIQMINGP
jgi:hypothetical protein